MWTAVGIGGAALISGALGASGAKKAAQIQAQSAREAIAEDRRQFDVTQSNLQPWLTSGKAALGKIGDLLGTSGNAISAEDAMAMDPGYQFRLAEGEKALDRKIGSMGLRNSGAALKAGTRYNQDYASGEFGNIYNRLAGVSGTGQQTGTNLGQFGAQSAGRIGDMTVGAGNARGAAAIGSANAWSNATNTIGNWFTQNAMMDKILNRGSYSGGGQSPAYGFDG